MIKRFDKRGQEGIGLGTIFALILGLAAVIIIFLWLNSTFNLFGSPADIDVDLVLMEQTCTNFLSTGDTFYCAGKYEVANDKFVGCVYATESLGLIIDFEEASPSGSEPDCDKTKINTQICTKIQVERGLVDFEGEKIYVNNELCSSIIKSAETPAE